MSNTVRKSCVGSGKLIRVSKCGALKIEADLQKTNQVLCGCSECSGCDRVTISKQNHRKSRIKIAKKYINDWDIYISAEKDRWNCGRKHTKDGRKHSSGVRVFECGLRPCTSLPSFSPLCDYFSQYYTEVI